MRKALLILASIACILLVVDIGLTVYTAKTATKEAESFMDNFEKGAEGLLE